MTVIVISMKDILKSKRNRYRRGRMIKGGYISDSNRCTITWHKPPVLLGYVACSRQFSLLPTALGVSFLCPLSYFWLLLTSVPIIKKCVLNRSLEMLSHISYLSMAPVLSPLLICTEPPCRKQLLFQSCDNGEFREREQVNPLIYPVT